MIYNYDLLVQVFACYENLPQLPDRPCLSSSRQDTEIPDEYSVLYGHAAAEPNDYARILSRNCLSLVLLVAVGSHQLNLSPYNGDFPGGLHGG